MTGRASRAALGVGGVLVATALLLGLAWSLTWLSKLQIAWLTR